MGVVNTTYTFTSTDTITSAKMNNIIDDTTFTSDAIQGTTLQVVSPGKLAVSAGGITSNELASNSVVTAKIADSNVTTAKIADASVTLAKLAPESLFPSGAVVAFAMNNAPSGWLAANGAEYAKTGTYAALFAAIGVTYGETNGSDGAGTSHFRVPDLRGYFVRGHGTNGDGTVSGNFGQKQGDAFENHTHNYVEYYNNTAGGNYGLPIGGGFQNRVQVDQLETMRTSNGANAGSDSETRPSNIAMLYCIKI